jgi:DNA primase
LPEDDLIDNQTVLRLIQEYKQQLSDHTAPDKNYFVYHPDQGLSTLAVSLLHFPHEESIHWKKELSQSTGYQKSLFEQDYKSFLNTLKKENETVLMSYLKIGKDNTHEEVTSAINYLKLKKIKKLLQQNLTDLEKANPTQKEILEMNQKNLQDLQAQMQTHIHIKEMEREVAKKKGTNYLK